MTPASTRPAWQALVMHHAHIGAAHLRELFAADPGRGMRFTVRAAGLYLDYAKNRIDSETIALLAALAQDCGLHERIAAMFRTGWRRQVTAGARQFWFRRGPCGRGGSATAGAAWQGK